MRYVESTLFGDERITYVGKTHWLVWLWPTLLVVLAAIFVVSMQGVGISLLVAALISGAHAFFYMISTDLAVTNKRIIGKWGFIRRTTIELRLEKVESVQVNQGIVERIFNAGSIVIIGTGGTPTRIPDIAKPLGFRAAVNRAIETREAPSPAGPAPTGGHRETNDSIEFKTGDDTAPRRGLPIAVVVVLAIVVLGASAFGGYSYLSDMSVREEAASSAGDPNAYEVVPYNASTVVVARDDGLRIRALPFARPDILVLRETQAGEVLNVVGIANQSDGPWYQVSLADGRTGFFKASLAVPEAEYLQSISGDSVGTNGSARTFAQLSNGMTDDDVIALLGQPSRRELQMRSPRIEQWWFGNRYVTIQNGIVTNFGIPDFDTVTLRRVDAHYGPGEQYPIAVALSEGETVSVDSIRGNWCMINSSEGMFVSCDAVRAPPRGWIAGETVKESCWPRCGD